MYSQPIEDGFATRIPAKSRDLPQALTFSGPAIGTHRHWKAVYEGQFRIMSDVPVYQIKPHHLLDPPQVGCLPGESGAMYTRQGGEEVGVMSAEVVKDRLVLSKTQVLPDHFHCQHFTIQQTRLRTSRS